MEALKVLKPTNGFVIARSVRDFWGWLGLTCRYGSRVLMLLGAWFAAQWLGFVPMVLTDDQILQVYNRYVDTQIVPVQQRAAQLEKQSSKHRKAR